MFSASSAQWWNLWAIDLRRATCLPSLPPQHDGKHVRIRGNALYMLNVLNIHHTLYTLIVLYVLTVLKSNWTEYNRIWFVVFCTIILTEGEHCMSCDTIIPIPSIPFSLPPLTDFTSYYHTHAFPPFLPPSTHGLCFTWLYFLNFVLWLTRIAQS